MAPQPPPTASRHYALSALLAQRAVTEARKARGSGLLATLRALTTHQVAAAQLAERAVAQMLIEQEIEAAADAMLNSLAFTTEARRFEAMATAAGPAGFDRLVESLVQDATRAAESVATAVRPDIYHIRYVTPPCCGRCAVLAGRVYRYSEGFLRHPNCDCVMVPTTVAAPFAQSPDRLFEQGQIVKTQRDKKTGEMVIVGPDFSKADLKAIDDGADIAQVVNVRGKKAGLMESGRVLARAGRPSPEGIYRIASDRAQAVVLLRKYGYVR